MTEETMTPEEQQAKIAEYAKNDQLMGAVLTAETFEERMAAARALGVMAPEEIQPIQTRLVLRLVRHAETNTFWVALECANKVVMEYHSDDVEAVAAALGGRALLVLAPMLSNEEHADFTASMEAKAKAMTAGEENDDGQVH